MNIAIPSAKIQEIVTYLNKAVGKEIFSFGRLEQNGREVGDPNLGGTIYIAHEDLAEILERGGAAETAIGQALRHLDQVPILLEDSAKIKPEEPPSGAKTQAGEHQPPSGNTELVIKWLQNSPKIESIEQENRTVETGGTEPHYRIIYGGIPRDRSMSILPSTILETLLPQLNTLAGKEAFKFEPREEGESKTGGSYLISQKDFDEICARQDANATLIKDALYNAMRLDLPGLGGQQTPPGTPGGGGGGGNKSPLWR